VDPEGWAGIRLICLDETGLMMAPLIREALVPDVPDERALPVFMSRKVVLPVVREEALTMPRLLRGIFRKRRELLLDLSQCAAEAVAEYVRERLGPDCRPGIVVSIATAETWPSGTRTDTC